MCHKNMNLSFPHGIFSTERVYGNFTVVPTWDRHREFRVWYVKLPKLSSRSPIMFVMPGGRRRAQFMLDECWSSTHGHDFLLLVPEFDEKRFPGEELYPYGNMFDSRGRKVDRRKWTYSIIEDLFDAVRHETGNTTEKYLMYGISMGGQFVHRLVLFLENARVKKAVAANSVWYGMPTYSIRYPYGLGNSECTLKQLTNALQAKLTILLGENDTGKWTHDHLYMS